MSQAGLYPFLTFNLFNFKFADGIYLFCQIQVFFVESVCEDPDVIAQNIVVSYTVLKKTYLIQLV